jgi:hypothetical protein
VLEEELGLEYKMRSTGDGEMIVNKNKKVKNEEKEGDEVGKREEDGTDVGMKRRKEVDFVIFDYFIK